MNIFLHMLCCLTAGEAKRDEKHTPDEDDLILVETDSRKRRSVTKQPTQRQVAVVKLQNVADRLRKPAFMSGILASTSITEVHRPKRTKTTKRKLPKGPKAGHMCTICGKVFTQRCNMIRHLGCVHGQNEDGTTATPETVARLRNSNRKRKAKHTKARATKALKSRELLSDASSSLSSPPHPQHVSKKSSHIYRS